VESMSEVQELNHRVAKARVLDTWNRQLAWKVREVVVRPPAALSCPRHSHPLQGARAEAERLADAAAMEEAIERDAEAARKAAERAAERAAGEAAACAVIKAQLEERAFKRELELVSWGRSTGSQCHSRQSALPGAGGEGVGGRANGAHGRGSHTGGGSQEAGG